MPKNVYDLENIYLMDGTAIEMGPLKIKFMKKFMDVFGLIKFARTDDQSIAILAECATICMRQYYPEIQTRDQLEDVVDLNTVYAILNVCAGIKINPDDEDVKKQAQDEQKDNSWDDLDLADLEAEAFMLGIWKSFEELEESLSMNELIVILEKTRELNYDEKKFLAAIQGIDLEKESNKNNGGDAWEKMKAKVFSGGKTDDPNDILALQGNNAAMAGFGLGMGLGYTRIERQKD